MGKIINIYGDGGSRGNPGPAASAFLVVDSGKVLCYQSKYLGKTTNNVAEYNCVMMALNWVVNQSKNLDEVIINLDSQLVVRQLTGVYKIKDKRLMHLSSRVKSLERKIGKKISYHHIPRTENKLADRLVNQELDKQSRAEDQ